MSEHTETFMSVASTAERQSGTDGSEYSVFLETISVSGTLRCQFSLRHRNLTGSSQNGLFPPRTFENGHIPSRTVAVSSWGSAVTPERALQQAAADSPSAPRGAPC